MAAGEETTISGRLAGRPKLLAAAIAAALSSTVPLAADAAGLGRLTVQSALGQPLRAEVEVTALGREEIGSLTARLASPEAFRQAGLEYNPALSGLRFAIEQRPNGGAVVRVASSQPVNEPFVDLLVELNWASGKFVREYTFLLDPPELRMGRDTAVAGGAATSTPAPAARQAAASAAAVPATAAPAPAAIARPVPASPAASSSAVARPPSQPVSAAAPARAADASGSVRVEAGDTLAKIAARVKPADVSVEQAVMAIYRANPRAFFGTVHQLFAGADLQIPDAEAMKAIDAAGARREIRAQAAQFNEYRARLASSVRSVQPTKAGQTAQGSVAAKSDESGAPVAGGDQLKLSRSGGAAAAAGSATGASAASNAEMQVAQDNALREQRERVAALERNVSDLQQLVELKNRQLAELQRQVEAARSTGATASGTIASATSNAAPVAAPAEPTAAAAPSATADAPATAPASAPATTSVASPAASEGAASPAMAPATSDASSTSPVAGDAVSPAETKPAEGVPPATAADTSAPDKPAATPAPAPVSPAEPSVLGALMENPLVLPALIAIALGLGGYGVYAARRRRKGEELDDGLSTADAFTANSLFGATGGQAVDTHASLFATSARDSGVDVHSTEVDPIAEAEVYIAYGREAQAEEILKEALKRQPERQAIRLKLLEIQAARKDPIAFGALAQEMYDQAGGLNEEWAKVVTLGLAIDPANPLYTGQGAAASTADSSAEASAAAPGVAPAAADLGREVDAAAAVFGEPGFDPAGSPKRAFGPSFAETVPMDGAEGASADGKPQIEEEVPALDFDLDLETTVGRAGSALGARDTDSALEQAVDGRFELPSLDLGLDAPLPAGDEHAARRSGTPQPDEEIPALADLGDFKIDLPSLEEIDARVPEFGDERPAVDLAGLEGADGLGDLDFSSVDLELSEGDVGLASAETAVAPAVASSRWQEMATKLDLAAAYEEIGDKEGARELLQEVLEGGDASQQHKARAMLGKIG